MFFSRRSSESNSSARSGQLNCYKKFKNILINLKNNCMIIYMEFLGLGF